jgi:hypothetical protein
MKKYNASLIVVLLFVSGFSCKKNSQSQEKKVNVLVTEYKSHAPVPGAEVDVDEISMDIFGGGALLTNLETLQTDADGICPVPESYFKDPTKTIVVLKDGFWHSDVDLSATTIPTTYELQRKSQLRVHLIQLNSYPNDTYFYIESDGELPDHIIAPFSRILIPADSTFTMDVYGGQTNQVHWKVTDLFNDTLKFGNQPLVLPPSGINDLEIKY